VPVCFFRCQLQGSNLWPTRYE